MGKEIRVVVFKDGDLYIAQALELDIAAQGKTPEEARDRLGVTIRAEVVDARKDGRDIEDIGPAPHPFHVMYEGDVVSRETMKAA